MIRRGEEKDLKTLAALADRLWPGHEPGALERELLELLRSPEAALFLADGAAGFAQCQLRHDYVEGTGHSPVGYLEGIWVREESRGKGIARQLLRACEEWAKAQGCREFASDCELTNIQSQRFHERAGFREANRIVCFVKEL